MIDRIRYHLDRGEFVQAAALGRGLYAVEDTPAAEKALAAVLAAEAMHRMRHFPGAVEMAQRALELALQEDLVEVEASALYRLCGSHIAIGDNMLALEAGTKYLELSEQYPELGQWRARCLLPGSPRTGSQTPKASSRPAT